MLTKEQVKHGQRIRCKIHGKEVGDARVSIFMDTVYICQDVISGSNPKEMFGYKYGWCWDANVTDVTAANPTTPEELTAGDEFINNVTKTKYFVHGRIGDVIVFSAKDVPLPEVMMVHVKTFKAWGFVIEQPEEKVEEMTMEEVCKALGKTIKIKK